MSNRCSPMVSYNVLWTARSRLSIHRRLRHIVSIHPTNTRPQPCHTLALLLPIPIISTKLYHSALYCIAVLSGFALHCVKTSYSANTLLCHIPVCVVVSYYQQLCYVFYKSNFFLIIINIIIVFGMTTNAIICIMNVIHLVSIGTDYECMEYNHMKLRNRHTHIPST